VSDSNQTNSADNEDLNQTEGNSTHSKSNQSDQQSNSQAKKSEAEEYKQQAEKYKSDLLYMKAEFDNYKKHAIRERSELAKYGSERLIYSLLDVLDNFERALQTKVTPENLETYSKGVAMTEKELRGVLQKFGVSEVDSVGQPFDPALHEAISSEESVQYAPGHISKVFRKAYKFHDRMLRPAQVAVAVKPSSETAN
jgi:molecular chaperone GrpE